MDDPLPVGNWSPVHRFTKQWAIPENFPVLIEPTEGDLLALFDAPAFSWTQVSGAAKYRFEISLAPDGFNSPLIAIETLTASYQPPDRLANGTYYWRVIPVDVAGHLGTSSSVQSFVMAYGSQLIGNMVPELISPGDGENLTFSPTFHWTAVEGAQLYRVEYTTANFCDFNVGMSFETHQTSFTPVDILEDSNQYCWRVRVESGQAVGDWSLVWHFAKNWNLPPILLTPTNMYETGLYPLYSWTPVPGAGSYRIEISKNSQFNPLFEESITSNTTYTPQTAYDGTAHYYWRVTPIDGSGKSGATSDIGEYHSVYSSLAPILIYPQYYYPPNNYDDFILNPYEDRIAAFPIFIWHKVMAPAPVGGVFAIAYRIQVDDSPNFDSINWQYDTENTSATPTYDEPFNPEPDMNYYWRVCPLTSLYNGTCVQNPDTEAPWWSQVWVTRFDASRMLPPTAGNAPVLLRPIIGQESVEATPLLEWWPMADASQYQVQVSRDAGFESTEFTQNVGIPTFSPKFSLAQRNLDRTDYGSFYWRVRGLVNNTWSDWSEVWRFEIASQSEWCYTRMLGFPENRLLIGNDPVGDVSQRFDLTYLYASQSDSSWFFGFNRAVENGNLTYVLYIDLDNIAGSGALSPPERDYHIQTNPEHQPEYSIYIDSAGGSILPENIWIFAWNGDHWGDGQRFSDSGGEVFSNAEYVELEVPDSSIGMDETTSSASLMLLNVDNTNGLPQDSVPSDPTVPGSAILTRFSAVSERINLIYPPSTAAGDPFAFPSVPPFYWDWPTGSRQGSNSMTPFAGSLLQVDTDPYYSLPHEATFQINSNTSYFSENNVTLLNDILGDSTYYWRIRPRYLPIGYPESDGPWTGGWSFQRVGLVPKNLSSSTVSSIISFGWDMAEGAEAYRLQVSSDPGYTNNVIDVTTSNNSFTPQDTLPQGSYYWRVQIRRLGNVSNAWAEGQPFEYDLPTPGGLNPTDGQNIIQTPTYCWNPVVVMDETSKPIFTAWGYHVQVSTDPNFLGIYDSADTYNNCWTPVIGYADGTYYWRVAMLDGSGKIGDYSQPSSFTKRYPLPMIITPKFGSLPATPTFSWQPVQGAATYVFELSHFPSFIPLYDSAETVNAQYTPFMRYEPNRYYYWRIALRDLDENQGDFVGDKFIIGIVYSAFMPQISR